MAQNTDWKQTKLDYLASQGGKASSKDVAAYMATTGIEEYDDKKSKKSSKDGRITTSGIVSEGKLDDFETALQNNDSAEMSSLIDSPWEAAKGIAPVETTSEFSGVEPGPSDLELSAKEALYYDPAGNKQTGYLIDDLTYKDASGTERVDIGSKVETGGGWYELGEDGGFAIDDPTLQGADSEYVDMPDLTSSTDVAPVASETVYYDAQGNEQTGYIINGQTFKDADGTERIDVGSKVKTAGGWFELGEDGGFAIDDPTIEDTTTDMSFMNDFSNMFTNEVTEPTEQVEVTTPYNDDTYTVDETVKTDEETYLSPEELALHDQTADLYNQFTEYTPEETMSQDEAYARADSQLNLPYDEAVNDLLAAYDKDAVQRGMFGQQPIEAMKRNAIAEVELEKRTAISDLSNELYVQDFEMGQAVDTSNLSRLSNALTASRAQLLQESAKKKDIEAYKASELASISEAEEKMVESAYKRWEALGSADQVVSDILGIPVDTLSSDNMKLQVENYYDLLLEEYKSTVASQEALAAYGYDISLQEYEALLENESANADYQRDVALAGYKGNINSSLAGYKASLDASNEGQALINKLLLAEGEAGIKLAADIALLEAEKEIKGEEDLSLTPAEKLDLLTKSLDFNGVDQGMKDIVYDFYDPDAILDRATMTAGEDGTIVVPSMEDILEDVKNEVPGVNWDAVMNTYNGFVNVMTGEAADSPPVGTKPDLSDYQVEPTPEDTSYYD